MHKPLIKSIRIARLCLITAIRILKLLRQVSRSKLIFFFPTYQAGGAERAHLDIVKAVAGSRFLIIFTEQSPNNLFQADFRQQGPCIDISLGNNNRLLSRFFYPLIVFLINRRKDSLSIFGCNTPYFYELLPRINNPGARRLDLLHAFSYPDHGIEEVSINYVQYLDCRVVSNEKSKADYAAQYAAFGVDPALLRKVHVVENAVYVSRRHEAKPASLPLHALFCGRGSVEKRPGLFITLAEQHPQLAIYQMIGSLQAFEPRIRAAGIRYSGGISTQQDLDNAYGTANILVLTSYREGFPMVIMEAMARGVICICTNVGSISEHIASGQNGFLVENSRDEQRIVDQIAAIMSMLQQNPELVGELSKNAHAYAQRHFDFERFRRKYDSLIFDWGGQVVSQVSLPNRRELAEYPLATA